jgi:hypothetical protein
VQTDATATCELLVGLRDVTVLGIDERLRQPLEVCVDPRHPGSIALSRSQKVQVPLFDAVSYRAIFNTRKWLGDSSKTGPRLGRLFTDEILKVAKGMPTGLPHTFRQTSGSRFEPLAGI